jgi:hypothetical protein
MKELLGLFTFDIGALCLVVFVAVFKPDALGEVHGPIKPDYCNTERQIAHALSATPCPNTVRSRHSTDARDRTSFAPETISPKRYESDQTETKMQENQRT